MVSVIVPAYNIERMLRPCVESILSQTCADFELLLADDGSADGSGAICDEYAALDDRVLVIHKKNGGVSSARNAGIDCAAGEYLCFVDSDDELTASFLSEMLRKAETGQAEIVVCGYQVVRNGSVVEERGFPGCEETILPRKNVCDLVERALYSAPWGKLFRGDIIRNNGMRFPETMSFGEDMVFTFMYSDHITNIFVMNKMLYRYNIDNTDSLLRGFRKSLFPDTKRKNQYVLACLRKWEVDENSMAMFLDSCYYHYENILYSTFSPDNPDSFREKIRFNNSVIRSREFREVCFSFSGKLKIFHRLAYRIGNYFPIYLYTSLRKALKK